MAELVAGAFLGAAVGQLLTSLIDIVNKFKDSNETLLNLHNRLERLKPFVEAVQFIRTESGHPASKWLCDLRQELQKAHDLVANSGGNVKRMLKSGSLEKINGRISELLTDFIALRLGEQSQLHRQLAQAITSASPHHREKEIKQITCQLDLASYRFADHGSSYSSTSIVKPEWSKACDIPDPPQITFGETLALADEEIQHILHGEYRKWIVMWGMGGVGKTFTASKVFHDASIQQHFTGGTYWVTVSKDQPPPQDILKMLYAKIVGRMRNAASLDFPDDLEAARSKVRSSLDSGRVLLVLDDVWQASSLEYLDVISEDRKGVILVTTRDKGSLKYESRDGDYLKKVVNCAKVVEIPRLSVDHSWQLFSWHAFDIYKTVVPHDLENVAREVAQECKGLPLALKVIGSTMGQKHLFSSDLILGRSLHGEWEKALQQLRSTTHHKDEYEELYRKLQWSVDNLVDQDPRLKDCFFYFAAYPEDYPVPVEELVSIWAAEGLCSREEAKSLLGFLIAKSMIELAASGENCKIHDVMRDLIRQNLNLDSNQGIHISEGKCLYAPGLALKAFPDSWTLDDVQLSAERLSIRDNCLRELPNQFNAVNLRVLMLGPNETLLRLPRGFFQNLSCLKVLVLRETAITRIRGAMLRNLKFLVLLDVTDCIDLLKISNYLNRLRNLNTILLQGCYFLRRLPQMKSLTKLHTLSVPLPQFFLHRFSWPTIRGARVGFQLQSLIDSTRLESTIFRCLGTRMYGLRHVFQLCNLRRLAIDGCSRGDWRLPDVASLSALEELRIGQGVQQTPSSLMGLRNLRVLHIYGNDDVTMPPLDELPVLEELSIRHIGMESLPESFHRNGAFPSLQKLSMDGMYRLTKFSTFNVGCMPKLESLWIGELGPGGIEVPVSLTTLTTLKSLCLDETSFKGNDCNALFMAPNCFPNLERLGLGSQSAKEKLPQHILEREAPQGKLKIEIVDFRDLYLFM